MKLRPQSLQAQLAVRLSLVFLAATALAVGVLLWQGSSEADRMHDHKLLERAHRIARHVVIITGGKARLELPKRLRRRYDPAKATNFYAVRLPDGIMIASDSKFGTYVGRMPAAASKPSYFRLEDFRNAGSDYYGVSAREITAAGPASIAVAHISDADEVAGDLLKEIVLKAAWLILLFAVVTLAIAIWSIRRGLKPVSAASTRAARIDPEAIGERLPTTGLPSELLPLVAAVNAAFDRLEKGFAVQRQFAANVAHELRTPLTMLTAGLEALAQDDAVTKLRADATRMNRIVDQLLRIARLDAVPLDLDETVNLGEVAAHVVAHLAPWAIAQGKELGLDMPDRPVLVKGNASAIAAALRNLIENGVNHTRPDTEVKVAVLSDGSVTVEDCGAGIPPEDRHRIFERFWRGNRTIVAGAGLGLSIVSEIVRTHGGEISVGEAHGGGASFALMFRRACED